MAAGLRPTESGTQGVRRIIRKDVKKASENLSAGGSLSDQRLHDVRKLMKRARAGLRLVRKSLEARAYHRENVALRDAARPLTEVRDAKVLVNTTDELLKRASVAERRALHSERAVLVANCRKVRQRLEENPKALTSLRRTLESALDRLDRWRPGKHGWSVLGAGVRRVYRAGHRAFRTARRNPSVENLHELRKQSQYLWHVLQLLQPIRPTMIKRLGGRAHRLSDYLGEDHDLAVLIERLRRTRGEAPSGGTETIVRMATQRRGERHTSAIALASRVFRKKPSTFSEGLKKSWDVWRSD